MRYKVLGRSGLKVSEISLGAMTFGEAWGWGSSKDVSDRILRTYLEYGGNFIDTANVYTDGEAEMILGEVLGARRGDIVLASKYTRTRNPENVNASGNHRKSLMESLEESLKNRLIGRSGMVCSATSSWH